MKKLTLEQGITHLGTEQVKSLHLPGTVVLVTQLPTKDLTVSIETTLSVHFTISFACPHLLLQLDGAM